MIYLYLMTWFIFLPSTRDYLAGYHNVLVYYQPKEFYILSISIFILFFFIYKRKQINFDKIDKMLYILGVVFLLAYTYTKDFDYGQRALLGYFMFLVAYSYFKYSKIKIKTFLFLLSIVGFLQSIISFSQYYGIYYKFIEVFEPLGRARIIGTIGHVNQFSHFQTMIFLLMIVYVFLEFNSIKKRFVYISIGMIYYSILICQTRASYLAIIISLFVFFVYGKKLILRSKKTAVNLLIIFFSLTIIFISTEYITVKNRIESAIKLESSANQRILCWIKTIRFIKEKPLLGHGTGSFYWRELEYEKKRMQYIEENKNLSFEEIKEIKEEAKAFGRTHNEYLQIFMENGIFVIIYVLFIIFYYWKKFIKSRTRIKLTGFLSLNACLVISFFSFPLHKVHNLLLFGIILGINSRIISKRGKK